ncbi:hypothetical protein SDC9_98472 [bioreactor metagenome]|uniref:Uncharacterized protein n=1 Tax=bioreactor metagenome TaxID=1076179 RepID=A0A645AHG3_9ZZZZ
MIVAAQRIDLRRTALMDHLGALLCGDQRQRLRHDLVERTRAQTAAHHQQFQRTGTTCKTSRRIGLLRKRGAQRVAHPLPLLEHVRERGEDAVGHASQYLVGHAGDRILLVQHQRLAGQHRHHSAGEGDIAAHADHNVRLEAPHHRQRLPECAQQIQRQQHQRHHALATHAGEIDGLQRKPLGRNDARLHAAGRTQPVHIPAAIAQFFSHGQAGEDVAAGAASHHERGALLAHTRPPRMSNLFS